MIRFATPADLAQLQGIEDAADRLLVERLRPERWAPAPTAAERLVEPGFVLVAPDGGSGDAIGFAHIVEVDGAHLDQLSVLPEHGRSGIGSALVRAALRESARRGHRHLTLRTYADVPWNAPFYRRLGFVDSRPDSDHLLALVETERRLGLDRLGRRVQMTASTALGAAR